MNKKYLSIHFEHAKNGVLGFTPRINPDVTSFSSGEFSEEESFAYGSKVYDIAHHRRKKRNGLSAQLSLEESADLTEYDNFMAYEYLNEPALHIFKIGHPFFDDEIDEIAYATAEGDLVTKLSSSLQEDENLEDGFLENQINDYSYGAQTDRLVEVESDILDDDFFLEDSLQKMPYETLLSHGILHVTLTGKAITLESNIANDTWDIYIDKKKLAEIYLSADECVLKDSIVTFYDAKGRVQKASGAVTFSDKKTIEFEDLDSIRWVLI